MSVKCNSLHVCTQPLENSRYITLTATHDFARISIIIIKLKMLHVAINVLL